MVRWGWSVVTWMVLGALTGLTGLAGLPAHAEQQFLQPEEAFRLSVSKQAGQEVRLTWDIAKGYYLYRKQMKVEADPAGSAQQINWPAGTLKTDETYGESEVYYGQVSALVNAPDAQALAVTWQGCADAGLCYPPQSKRLKLADVALTPAASTGMVAGSPAPAVASLFGEDQDLADRLSRLHLGWMVAVFLASAC